MSKEFINNIVEEFNAYESKPNGLSGSDFHKIKKEAISNFSELGLPTPKHEDWKYTSVNFLRKHDFKVVIEDKNVEINPEIIEKHLLKEMAENLLVFVNGYFRRELSRIREKHKKVIIGGLAEAINEYPETVQKHFACQANCKKDAFTALNTAFAQDGVFLYLPDNYEMELPVHFLYINTSDDEALITNPRNLILIGENSKVKLIETVSTHSDKPSFTNMVTEVNLGRYAKVDYCKIQNDSENSYFIGTTKVVQESSSEFQSSTITFGGKFVRNNLHVLMNGEHCESNFNGFYYMDGDRFVDNHTIADHAFPNCNSDEVFKGILDDKSTAVFNGKVLVREHAQKTNAYQSNKNILLSDTATINSKPELEIYADDVKCSHGATSGSLDQDSLFYLKSRGISERLAKSLLLNAFANDVIEKVQLPELRQDIKRRIGERLGISDLIEMDERI
jgi:Fe-S cluster assembly protein SufD